MQPSRGESRARRIFRALALLLAAAASGPCQQQAEPQSSSSRLQTLVSAAIALPPEYSTDILLTLLSNGAIRETDSPSKSELLELLFDRASAAKHPYAMRNVSAHYNDTASGRLSAAYRLELDSLSIQCRVVREMLSVSPRKARELFARIPPIKLEPVDCRSPLVYDVGIYYRTLVDVYNRAFIASERKRGNDWAFLQDRLPEMTSISQLPPEAEAILNLPLSARDRHALLNLYARQLSAIDDGDRTFAFVEKGSDLENAIQKLVALAKSSDDHGTAGALLAAYRRFLVRHLSGARCLDSPQIQSSDSGHDNATNRASTAANHCVRFFNEVLAPLGDESALRIDPSENEVRPTAVLDGARLQPLQIPSFHGLLSALMLRRNGRPDGLENRQWESEISRMLEQLEEPGDTSAECPPCRFHERASVYVVLVDLLDGPLETRAVDSYILFLSRDSMQYDDPIQWLAQVKIVLNLTRTLSDKERNAISDLQKKGKILNMLPNPYGPRILEGFRQNGNATLAAYAELQSQPENVK